MLSRSQARGVKRAAQPNNELESGATATRRRRSSRTPTVTAAAAAPMQGQREAVAAGEGAANGGRQEAKPDGASATAGASPACAVHVAAGSELPSRVLPLQLPLPLPLPLSLLAHTCSYLPLSDLASLLAASRACVALVAEQLPQLGLSLQLPRGYAIAWTLESVCAARLRRHVGEITQAGRSDMRITVDSLALLADRMPHLTACSIEITEKSVAAAAAAAAGAPAPGPSPIRLPPALRRFAVDSLDTLTAAEADALLHAAATQLDQLEGLVIHLPTTPPSDRCLAALPRMRKLRTLRILWNELGYSELTDGQIADLRAVPALEDVFLHAMSAAMLRRLLRPPHQLRWTPLHCLPERIDDNSAETLTSLSATLTAIDLFECSRLSSFDFLRRLPQLLELRLDTCSTNAGAIASLLRGLQSCVRVEVLALRQMGLSSAQLASLLPHLPRLRKLTVLCGGDTPPLATLSCFSGAALAPSLVRLDVGFQNVGDLWMRPGPPMPVDELRHLLPLRRLRTLIVRGLFPGELDPTAPPVAPFTLPSLALPSLTCVQLQCRYGYPDSRD